MGILTKSDYEKILNYYNIPFSPSDGCKTIKSKAEQVLAEKLCKCIKKLDPENEARSIGICTKTIINNKGFTRGKFTCKGKQKITFKKNNKTKKINIITPFLI
jgi:hypothetical protein